MSENQPFIAIWDVTGLDRRVRGEWVHEYDFAPGEWAMMFAANGRYADVFRSTAGKPNFTRGEWTMDPAGILWLSTDDFSHESALPAVFVAEASGEPYLCLFDQLPHIPPDAATIVAHHAHTRRRLAKVSKK